MLIEKGMDSHSLGAVGQCDLEKYYDSIPCLRVLHWAVAHGLSPIDAACMLRHQMLCTVVLRCTLGEAVIEKRASGALTGLRLAGQMGRIPVEEALLQCLSNNRRRGFRLQHSPPLCYASLVDNLVSFSTGAMGAARMLMWPQSFGKSVLYGSKMAAGRS